MRRLKYDRIIPLLVVLSLLILVSVFLNKTTISSQGISLEKNTHFDISIKGYEYQKDTENFGVKSFNSSDFAYILGTFNNRNKDNMTCNFTSLVKFENKTVVFPQTESFNATSMSAFKLLVELPSGYSDVNISYSCAKG